ncbi:Bax inhibitor-1/YccA family protein [bacterium]|nr:Bax inhibitor-1/YccA family protein [bacterium]
MANPILRNSFDREGILEGDLMTVNGAVLKSIFLLVTIILSAAYTWQLAITGFVDKMYLLVAVGLIGGTIAGLVTVWFKPRISPILSLIYAVCEGFFLGGISVMYESSYHGIVLKAIFATFAVMAVMLFLYITRLIRMTEKLWAFILTATASIALIYLIQIGASFFGRSIPLIFSSGPYGIGFSLIVIGIAALNLIADFSIIEEGARHGLPKKYEWVGAVGLMFSLVWLYLEILRLFAKRN